MINDEMELDDPPLFEIGEKVMLRKVIRNDGTFAGVAIGARLANKGESGYVISIGTFLQTSYIYAVHFLDTGRVVGCRRRELISCVYDDSEELSKDESPTDDPSKTDLDQQSLGNSQSLTGPSLPSTNPLIPTPV
ncbi:nitrogen fixation protein NifZ [Vulcanococcus limneticus Candia 3F8]|uniref:nitrogen fixation protein NifZ n=1 Tax=Vulcanococcus limneticus TaxID=2170428 RepID=UPI000B9808E9|nr:nitrogen fixation protein NifZ [Vulcanococcus limneticus]MCP9792943.1 nitrogen fixation protein NifZ [Vulcanococcus limneticus MW73D5]MCP9894848.1 nitrogen fixation protein NifZ [Vulcanococcus limneticus Candia 3F8]MCP9898691.1 nitrogen fixation protein NifZ [Vulcanococcus limneticus Candia 3B3]